MGQHYDSPTAKTTTNKDLLCNANGYKGSLATTPFSKPVNWHFLFSFPRKGICPQAEKLDFKTCCLVLSTAHSKKETCAVPFSPNRHCEIVCFYAKPVPNYMTEQYYYLQNEIPPLQLQNNVKPKWFMLRNCTTSKHCHLPWNTMFFYFYIGPVTATSAFCQPGVNLGSCYMLNTSTATPKQKKLDTKPGCTLIIATGVCYDDASCYMSTMHSNPARKNVYLSYMQKCHHVLF